MISEDDPAKPDDFVFDRYGFLDEPEDSALEEIEEHIEMHLGEVSRVWHEVISEEVHIDLHPVNPSRERPFHTIVTSVMSDRPLAAPAKFPECRFVELMLNLPSDWPMTSEAWKDEANYWPIYHLKRLARFPHTDKTWLWRGHTVDFEEPLGPGTEMTAHLIYPDILAPVEFDTLKVRGREIHFFAVFSLYPKELEFARAHGSEALMKRLLQVPGVHILNPTRPSAV